MTGPAPEASPVRAPIEAPLLQRVLTPYLPHSRYVQRATFAAETPGAEPDPADRATWLRVDADCGIDASCYIESTGHYNAVELNITYNQMLYLGLAEALRRELLPQPGWSFDDFFRHQLPNVLIADYQARFRRPMTSKAYRGWMAITQVQRHAHRNMLLLKTRAGCSNQGDDACEARVTIALLDWPAA
jgi:hypothetical protein